MNMKANGAGFDTFDPFTMPELGATRDFNSTGSRSRLDVLLDGLGGGGGLDLERQMTSI